MKVNPCLELTPVSVTRGSADSLINDGLCVVRCAFPGDQAAESGIRALYGRLRNGTAISPEEELLPGLGMTRWEAVSYYVYYKDTKPVAVGGLYRYEISPDEYWLGRLGVIPEHQGDGYGTHIVEHLKSILKKTGVHSLLAFTEAEPSNKAHSFYLKRGWKLTDRTVSYDGKLQAVYICEF